MGGGHPDPEIREVRCKNFFFGGLKIRGKGPGPPCPSPGSATDIDSKPMFTPLYTRKKSYPICIVRTATALNWNKLFTYIEHRTRGPFLESPDN